MKAITPDEMKTLESDAVKMGLTSRILMEIAGMKVANIAANEVKHARSACIVCGTGGNGGDGFVAARYLNNSAMNVDVFITDHEDRITSQDSKENLKVLRNMGINIVSATSDDAISAMKASLLKSDIVIDAIFGTGFHGEIKNGSQVTGLINLTKGEIKNKRPYAVISVDVPSGINALSGEAAKDCVQADLTICLEMPKIGLFKFPASKYAGKIVTTSIGIPKHSIPAGSPVEETPRPEGFEVTDAKHVSAIFPRRRTDSHKGNSGRLLVIAGASGMIGAAVITSISALRTGSGLVTLCVPDNLIDLANSMALEVVVAGISDLDEKLNDCDVIAIGPGLSRAKHISKLVNKVILSKTANIPIVIDADGLNAIDDSSIFHKSNKDIVITPHPGEFARLTGESIEHIQQNRIASASRYAVDNGITVVLKGAYTIIAGKDKSIFVNPTANPGMATAGTGDVLCGIIASLIGQGATSFNSAVSGVYIHAMAANLTTSMKGQYGIIASDIIESIPYTIESLL